MSKTTERTTERQKPSLNERVHSELTQATNLLSSTTQALGENHPSYHRLMHATQALSDLAGMQVIVKGPATEKIAQILETHAVAPEMKLTRAMRVAEEMYTLMLSGDIQFSIPTIPSDPKTQRELIRDNSFATGKAESEVTGRQHLSGGVQTRKEALELAWKRKVNRDLQGAQTDISKLAREDIDVVARKIYGETPAQTLIADALAHGATKQDLGLITQGVIESMKQASHTYAFEDLVRDLVTATPVYSSLAAEFLIRSGLATNVNGKLTPTDGNEDVIKVWQKTIWEKNVAAHVYETTAKATKGTGNPGIPFGSDKDDKDPTIREQTREAYRKAQRESTDQIEPVTVDSLTDSAPTNGHVNGPVDAASITASLTPYAPPILNPEDGNGHKTASNDTVAGYGAGQPADLGEPIDHVEEVRVGAPLPGLRHRAKRHSIPAEDVVEETPEARTMRIALKETGESGDTPESKVRALQTLSLISTSLDRTTLLQLVEALGAQEPFIPLNQHSDHHLLSRVDIAINGALASLGKTEHPAAPEISTADVIKFALSLVPSKTDLKNMPAWADVPTHTFVTAQGRFRLITTAEGIEISKVGSKTQERFSIQTTPDQESRRAVVFLVGNRTNTMRPVDVTVLLKMMYGTNPSHTNIDSALLLAAEFAAMRNQAGNKLQDSELRDIEDLITDWHAPKARKATIARLIDRRLSPDAADQASLLTTADNTYIEQVPPMYPAETFHQQFLRLRNDEFAQEITRRANLAMQQDSNPDLTLLAVRPLTNVLLARKVEYTEERYDQLFEKIDQILRVAELRITLNAMAPDALLAKYREQAKAAFLQVYQFEKMAKEDALLKNAKKGFVDLHLFFLERFQEFATVATQVVDARHNEFTDEDRELVRKLHSFEQRIPPIITDITDELTSQAQYEFAQTILARIAQLTANTQATETQTVATDAPVETIQTPRRVGTVINFTQPAAKVSADVVAQILATDRAQILLGDNPTNTTVTLSHGGQYYHVTATQGNTRTEFFVSADILTPNLSNPISAPLQAAFAAVKDQDDPQAAAVAYREAQAALEQPDSTNAPVTDSAPATASRPTEPSFWHQQRVRSDAYNKAHPRRGTGNKKPTHGIVPQAERDVEAANIQEKRDRMSRLQNGNTQ